MNHPQNKTFHFISTHHFPGLPLSDSDISIKGSVLENTNEKIFLRIKKFLNENKNASIDALVVTITDVIDQTEINEIKKLLPNLNHIATFAVGYNNIDTQHAKTLGIRVTNTPGVIAEATADIALTLLLCTTRRVAEGYDMLKKQGEFPGWSPNFLVGKGLQGKTLGIVGYGDIGKAFAKRAQSLGMHCVALRSLHENSTPNKEDENIARYPEDEFLKKCDVISLHVPSTKYTQNWLNKERILQMKKGSIVA